MLPVTITSQRDGGRDVPHMIVCCIRGFLHGTAVQRWWRLMCLLMDRKEWTPTAQEPLKIVSFISGALSRYHLVILSPCRSVAVVVIMSAIIKYDLSTFPHRALHSQAGTCAGTRVGWYMRRDSFLYGGNCMEMHFVGGWERHGAVPRCTQQELMDFRSTCFRNYRRMLFYGLTTRAEIYWGSEGHAYTDTVFWGDWDKPRCTHIRNFNRSSCTTARLGSAALA